MKLGGADSKEMKRSSKPIESLPEEIWFRIFEIGIQKPILMLKDISSLSLSCKLFNRLLDDDALWSRLIAQDFPQYANDQTLASSSYSTKKLLYKNTLGRYVQSKIAFTKREILKNEARLVRSSDRVRLLRDGILEVTVQMEDLSQELLKLINTSDFLMSFEEKETLQRIHRRINEVKEESVATVNKSTSGQDPFATTDYLRSVPSLSTPDGPSSLTPSSLVHLETKGNEMLANHWNVVSKHQVGRCQIYTLLRELQEHANQLETFSSCLASLCSGPNPIEISDEVGVEDVDVDVDVDDNDEYDDTDDDDTDNDENNNDEDDSVASSKLVDDT